LLLFLEISIRFGNCFMLTKKKKKKKKKRMDVFTLSAVVELSGATCGGRG
jgi:hypothetical protein